MLPALTILAICRSDLSSGSALGNLSISSSFYLGGQVPTTKIGQIIKARAPAETVTRQLPSSIAHYNEVHLVSAIVHSVSSMQLTER